ncbi:hypothetical protein GGR54DRAFT_631762 [Hypoxylon sp. NC1633]|nr:hypothetical protein GGR54DRAFT_631762 [Hypoxylon sp. NC1633]
MEKDATTQRLAAMEKDAMKTTKTTLEEYIEATHKSVFIHFSVESIKPLTTKGTINNPRDKRDKLCPTNIMPWSTFLEQQRKTFGTMLDTFPTEERCFEPRIFLDYLGQRISGQRIDNEKALEHYLHNSVEEPVRLIVNQMKTVHQSNYTFRIGDGIVFQNHPHALSDTAEELSSVPIHPDQICVYQSGGTNGRRAMLYVSEYKAPHKLTPAQLHKGLRPMDIYKEVMNRQTIPTDDDPVALFQYNAERLTAAALTQTYNYMIEGGLEFGLLTTGEAHFPDHPENMHVCTAVGQYLAFTLMALKEFKFHSQEERDLAIEGLKTWTEDFESIVHAIPFSARTTPTGSTDSTYVPSTYRNVPRSPIRRRYLPARRGVEGDIPDNQAMRRRRDPESSSDDDVPNIPSSAEQRRRRENQGRGQNPEPRRSERIRARQGHPSNAAEEQIQDHEPHAENGQSPPLQYCTQKCLLGLVNGDLLDTQCPNTSLHRRFTNCGSRHAVDHAEFLRLLHDQLQKSLDDGVEKLYLEGARGVLFRITLLAYGYTFVSKGTVAAFIPTLRNEAAVYERLASLQGEIIPVFLGAIDLRPMKKIYYYVHRVYIVYMMLLSWAGEAPMSPIRADDVLRCLRSIHQSGVAHRDIRDQNVLLDPRSGRVMVTDFERAAIVKSACPTLSQVVPNKRSWDHGKDKEKFATSYDRSRVANSIDFQRDVSAAQHEFKL